MKTTGCKPLKSCVAEALDSYFQTLDGHEPHNLYDLFIGEVEQPLLARVLRECGGNQTQAAKVLGMSRGTLRKKLRDYNIE